MFTVGAEETAHEISINDFISEFGRKKWRELSEDDKQRLIDIRLLSIRNI